MDERICLFVFSYKNMSLITLVSFLHYCFTIVLKYFAKVDRFIIRPTLLLFKMDSLSRRYFTTLLISMVISGSINTLDNKFQNQQKVQEGQYDKYFYHPYMQTYVIYIATTLALPIYLLRKKLNPEIYARKLEEAQSQGKVIKYNKNIILICTISNIIGNTFQNISLNFISGSVYQMTRGGTIATTFLFSIVYLKNKAKKHQVAGSCLTVLGVIVVGLSNIIYSQSTSKSSDSGILVLGYILLIISLFLNGFSLTFEQNLLRKYHLQPIELTGYQGIYGLSLFSLFLVALTFIPCPFSSSACVYYSDNPYMERPDVYFTELRDHYPLLLTSILEVFSLLVFNISGLTITNYINSLSRAICDVTRTVIIWLVGIIVTVTVGDTESNYKWQSTEGGSIGMQLAGFVFVVLGNFVYNQIIVLPFLKVDEKIDDYEALEQKTAQNK